MKLGIMQPYFLPYLGYWQLMRAVDTYVIYDDVAYIKQGWINRNRMLLNGKEFLFSIPVVGASSFKNINETEIVGGNAKLLRTVEQAYARAPQFREVFPLVQSILGQEERNLARFVTHSIRAVAGHLGIQTRLLMSSETGSDRTLKAQERILHICEMLGASAYYNAVGGQELYSAEDFARRGIELRFLTARLDAYPQFNRPFVPGLSILDVMMFNPVVRVRQMLEQYDIH